MYYSASTPTLHSLQEVWPVLLASFTPCNQNLKMTYWRIFSFKQTFKKVCIFSFIPFITCVIQYIKIAVSLWVITKNCRISCWFFNKISEVGSIAKFHPFIWLVKKPCMPLREYKFLKKLLEQILMASNNLQMRKVTLKIFKTVQFSLLMEIY
jgi:hypothetical protein